LLALLLACSGSTRKLAETPVPAESGPVDPRGFDPLELSRDREVVPSKYSRTGEIIGKQVIVEAEPSDAGMDSTESGLVGPVPQVDTLNNQVYRVQIFTSRVYGDARRAARVAEEIFDQPVYVEYEVPNYKVRVGGFGGRYDAEDYQQKAKAAGYRNAWVVMVNVGIKEVAPLYQKDRDLFLPVPQNPEATVGTDDEEGSGSED